VFIAGLQQKKLLPGRIDPLKNLGLGLRQFMAVVLALGSQSVLKLFFDQSVLLLQQNLVFFVLIYNILLLQGTII